MLLDMPITPAVPLPVLKPWLDDAASVPNPDFDGEFCQAAREVGAFYLDGALDYPKVLASLATWGGFLWPTRPFFADFRDPGIFQKHELAYRRGAADDSVFTSLLIYKKWLEFCAIETSERDRHLLSEVESVFDDYRRLRSRLSQAAEKLCADHAPLNANAFNQRGQLQINTYEPPPSLTTSAASEALFIRSHIDDGTLIATYANQRGLEVFLDGQWHDAYDPRYVIVFRGKQCFKNQPGTAHRVRAYPTTTPRVSAQMPI